MNTLFDKIWDAHVVQKVEDGPHSFILTGFIVMK